MNTSLAIFESFHDEKSTGRTALQLPVIHLNQLPCDHLSKPVAKPEDICQNNGNVCSTFSVHEVCAAVTIIKKSTPVNIYCELLFAGGRTEYLLSRF